MSKLKSDDLLKKYLAAESSREEEEQLFNAGDLDPAMDQWSNYIKQGREKAPKDLRSSVRTAIQSRQKTKQRYLVGLSGMAASITLLAAFYFANLKHQTMDYEEKKILLEQALSMFPDGNTEPVIQTIIYEDDMVVIHLASN